MNWNDYEAVWNRQELPVGAGADVTTLRATFETKRRKMAGTLLVRDLIEAAAGLLCIVSYGWFWRKVGPDGWPMGFAIALILGVTLFFLRERLRTRRNRLNPGAPLLARVEADIAELRHQRRLLLNVWVWYLAPILAALLIHASVILRQLKPWDRQPLSLFGLGVFIALLFWFVWALNRRSVRKWIEPRLEELEKLHRDLLSPE